MAPGQVILLVLRLGIGGIFLYAGALKIWDPQQFALDVEHYELTSRSVSTLVAIYLPWLEAITGLALLTRRFPLGALLLLAGMTLVFIAAIISAWARGLDISCGCFGREADAIKTNFPLIIGRDLALLAGIGLLLVSEWRQARRQSL